MNGYLIGFYICAVISGYFLQKVIVKLKLKWKNRTKRKPGRFKVASRAFFSILRGRTHVFCDEETRSVYGDGNQVSYYQANISDLYRQSVETQLWMRNVEKILKGEK